MPSNQWHREKGKKIQRSILSNVNPWKNLILEWKSDSPTRSELFRWRVEDCWGSVSAVFPLEATRGGWQCSQNTGQAVSAVLHSSGVRFTRTRTRQSGGRVVCWSTFTHTKLWVLDRQTDRQISELDDYEEIIHRHILLQCALIQNVNTKWWEYNVFWIQVQSRWMLLNLKQTVCIFEST